MTNRVAVALALAGLCVSCRRSRSGPTDAGEVPSAESAGESADAGPPRIDDRVIDAYLGYQRLLRGRRPRARALGADAGPLAALEAVRQDAAAEARARREAGLSEPALDELESLITEVLVRRSVSKALHDDEMLARMEELHQALAPEHRAGVEKAIAALKQREGASRSLAQARARFGDAAIDAAVRREAELTKSWEQGLEAPDSGSK